MHDLAYGDSRGGLVKSSLEKWLKPKKGGVSSSSTSSASDTKSVSSIVSRYPAPIIKMSKFIKRDSKSKDAEKRRKKGYKKARVEKRGGYA